jgi:hypothetical protein
MEGLIAAFPDDFFFGRQFVLLARQQSLAGVGRFDLLFEDRFNSMILMELKARTLKYEDATQVADYRDELNRRGCRNVVMWLVAPHVPRSVREFLDDKGMEYTEIHFAEFRRVAERHGFPIESDAECRAKQVATARPRHNRQAASQADKQRVIWLDLEKAKERLVSDWTVRDLLEVLEVHKSNAHRRLKGWLATGVIEKVSAGKRGRAGGLAKYRFLRPRPMN